MQPEDIDRLFRDRLRDHAPTPPDHLWAQVQQELRPAKKRPAMWLYAAAAMVALLLVAGLGWLLRGPGSPTAPDALATAAPTPATPKKELTTQATAPQDLASTPSEAPVAAAPGTSAAQTALPAVRRSAPAVAQAPRMAAASAASARPAPAAVVRLAALPQARPERLEAVATSEAAPAVPATLTSTLVAARPIEVEVRREAEMPVLATAQAPAAPRTRLGAVLRQARNAITGDPVDLQQVGLPETLTVQARVAGHQLNKTIQL